MLHIDDLRPAKGANKSRKRVGRGHGSGHVKTSGRGQKGQGSRSGGSTRPGFEGGQNPIYRRMPYKRGFTNIFAVKYETLNLKDFTRMELTGEVTPELLAARGALSHTNRPLKILGDGDLNVALHVKAHKFTESAREKIEAAGGTVEVIS